MECECRGGGAAPSVCGRPKDRKAQGKVFILESLDGGFVATGILCACDGTLAAPCNNPALAVQVIDKDGSRGNVAQNPTAGGTLH